MGIYNFSRILAIPFAVAFGYVLYRSTYDPFFEASIWMIPFGMALVMIYVMSPQIDHWWQNKFPISLDPELVDLIQRFNPDYATYDTDTKAKFDKRLGLFLHGKEFSAQGSEKEKVPYDIQALIAQVPIQMTIHHEKYMFGDLDRVVIYKHPFPSPRFPFLHAVETFMEDGMIILSMAHIEAGLNNPKQFYHVIYHAYAEAFVLLNPKLDWPDMSKVSWESLQEVSGFPTQKLLEFVGFKELDILYVCITYFFTFPDKLNALFPEVYSGLEKIFKHKL